MHRCYATLRPTSKPWPRNSYDYSFLLRSHSDPKPLAQIHAQAITSGLEPNPFLASNLVGRYAGLGCAGMANARQVFDRAPHRDAFLWNVMLRGYANAGPPAEAVVLFARMRASSVPANCYTYPFVIKACAAVGDARLGRAVHALVVRVGLDLDVFVGNALVAFYAKYGDVEVARKVFDGIAGKDVVSWNSMITGYVQNDRSYEAVTLLHSMLRHGAVSQPDHVTFVAVLPACAALVAVREGLWAHSYVVKTGIGMDAALTSGFIGMYATCGRLDTARSLFDRVPQPNLIVYNSMIQAYGSHGHGAQALDVFDRMLATGIAPDAICFVSVLSACAHGGLVDQGLEIFDMMGDYGIKKGQVHYACTVDLLGRAGQLARALALIKAMPFEPGKDVWGALLGACRLHNDIELAEQAAKQLFLLDPENAGRYSALAHMYEDAGRWDDAARVRKGMRDRGVKKPLGGSMVEGDTKMHLPGTEDVACYSAAVRNGSSDQ